VFDVTQQAERDHLTALPAFEGLSSREFDQLVAMASRRELSVGQTLFNEDEPADSLYVLLTGSIQLYVHGGDGAERAVAQLGPGAAIGEISLLLGGGRSVSARALADSTLLRVPHDRFRVMIDSGSLLAYRVVHNLARILAARLRAADDLVSELSAGRSESAVAEDDLDRLRKTFFTEWSF